MAIIGKINKIKLDTTQGYVHNEDIQKENAIKGSKGTKQMKTLQEAKILLVFIHTKLMNIDNALTDVIMAVPHWQAKYSKVFTSVSSDYATYTPIAFDSL